LWGDELYYDYTDDVIRQNGDITIVGAESFMCIQGYENIHNLTGVMTDVVNAIYNLSKIEWFKNQSGSWLNMYNPIFAEILLKHGKAFSFNTKRFEEIYNAEL
jgi:hypothetical protein